MNLYPWKVAMKPDSCEASIHSHHFIIRTLPNCFFLVDLPFCNGRHPIFGLVKSVLVKNHVWWSHHLCLVQDSFFGEKNHRFVRARNHLPGGCFAAKVHGCRHWSSQRLAATGDLPAKETMICVDYNPWWSNLDRIHSNLIRISSTLVKSNLIQINSKLYFLF